MEENNKVSTSLREDIFPWPKKENVKVSPSPREDNNNVKPLPWEKNIILFVSPSHRKFNKTFLTLT